MAALNVGDRVLYEGKAWRVVSLAHHAFQRRGGEIVAKGELHATLLLDADPPGSQPPYKIVVAESVWDEVRLLED